MNVHRAAVFVRLTSLLVVFAMSFQLASCSTSDSDSESNAANGDENTANDDGDTANDDGDSGDDDVDEQTSDASDADRVLRHAVFFSFKDTSSEEDVQRIVDAFGGLPEKIDAIIDYEWGTNNSPEEMNDGFTHCFLLTFADEAGREEYLPHPEHKAFGDVLRGHNDQVFVLDYWGQREEPSAEKRLRHAVFFKFKDDASEADVEKVTGAFAELQEKIDVIKGFEWGTNNSPERHSAGFTHCFLVTFDSEEGRKEYLWHKDHLEFVEILRPHLDKARVLDYWTGE